MNCSLCQGNRSSVIARTDCKSRKNLNVVICDDCGLIQQDPVPSASELKNYYAKEYRIDYKRTLQPKAKHIHRSVKQAARRLDFLRKSGISSGKLLDIGSGSGEFVAICGRGGFDAEGAEPNHGYSDYARSQYRANVLTRELHELEGSYDIVTLFHVLEHLPHPVSVFGKLHSLLRPGGRLLVEVPWGLSPSISPTNRYFKAHLYYFDSETLAACASPYFDIVSTLVDGNLSILFQRKESASPPSPALPPRPYALAAGNEARHMGWWRYLIRGKGIFTPWRKLRKLVEEYQIRHLTGSAIVDLSQGRITGH